MYTTFFGGATCPRHPEATVSRGFGVWAKVYRLTEDGAYHLRKMEPTGEYQSVMRYQYGCNVCVREEVRDWGDWKPVSVDDVPEDVRAELAAAFTRSKAECDEYNAKLQSAQSQTASGAYGAYDPDDCDPDDCIPITH